MNQILGSGWVPLLWKEWRQQRLAALLLGLFCLLVYLGFSAFFYWDPAGIGFLFLLPAVALCLGTNAFTAEADDRTVHFMRRLPLPAWRLLAAKYLVTGGLAFLCLLPCFLIHVALVLLDARYQLAYFLPGIGIGGLLLLVTGTIALAGALARQGLGGMGTLLTSGGLGCAAIFLFGWAEGLTRDIFRFRSGGWGFLLAFWCVPHLWFLVTWLHRSESKPSRRGAVAWSLLLLLLPLFPVSALVAHREAYCRLRMPYGQWLQVPSAGTKVSPDGRTIAFAASFATHVPIGNSSLWLIDVESGRGRRMGIGRQRYLFGLPPAKQMTWSPDGEHIQIYENPTRRSYPVFQTEGETAVEQWTVDTRNGSIEKTENTADALVVSWFADGTKAVCTPTAWEFTGDTTDEVRSCLHPSAEDAVGKLFYAARSFQSNHAVYAVSLERDDGGGATCHVWRSAPDLSRAERQDFRLDLSSAPEKLLPAGLSPDAQWLLFTLLSTKRHPFWLMSLADGTCRLLGPVAKEPPVVPFFTPDSKLLLTHREDSLAILELPGLRWRAQFLLPVPNQPGTRASIRTSAKRPHCLAVTGGRPQATFVVDLDQRKSVRVFPSRESSGNTDRGHNVLWFDGERLLLKRRYPNEIWAVNADGSSCRQVLP